MRKTTVSRKARKTVEPREQVSDEEFKPRMIKHIRTKTANQAKYLRAMRTSRVVFCLGPAGCGKTYLSVYHAAQLLAKGDSRKIILTRPMIQVESKDELGFLPGDVRQKTKEFATPLDEALEDFFSKDDLLKLEKLNRIKFIPVGVMRGRSIRDSVVIVDEAQNCTVKQLRMILTRFEASTTVILCGDANQTDIRSSHFQNIAEDLSQIEGIALVSLTGADNQRDPLTAKIDEVFEKRYKGVST
jgi:phosphate starvation-inducible protein PhoH and related proteins